MNANIFTFKQVKICSNTKLTLVNVTKCPDSDKELLERSRKKHCEILCDGRPCVYHCVKHNDKNVEVCAPVEKIRGITKRNDKLNCLFFLTKFSQNNYKK